MTNQSSSQYKANQSPEIINPQEKDLGGFSVRRLLPAVGFRSVGPWVFFDHMGPASFSAGEGIDVRPHPHIGLATVTYLFAGEMLHRDSLGNEQVIRPGAVNLMLAGRGIVHSERQREAVKAKPHQLHGLQLWLALPEKLEQCEPAFFHYAAEQIPATIRDEITIRVIMGEAYELSSPVKTFSETLYFEASIPAGKTLALPEVEELAIYVLDGEVSLEGRILAQHHLGILCCNESTKITANTTASIAVVGGESLGKRTMEWNFVASDPVLIEQAKANWSSGHFPKVPGDEDEFIPLP